MSFVRVSGSSYINLDLVTWVDFEGEGNDLVALVSYVGDEADEIVAPASHALRGALNKESFDARKFGQPAAQPAAPQGRRLSLVGNDD